MTTEEAQTIIDGWIEEIIENLSPAHRALPGHERWGIVEEALARRYDEAIAKGGRDRDALNYHIVASGISEYLASNEPQGRYRPDGLLVLSETEVFIMASATREKIIRWRDHMSRNPDQGNNLANLLYIETRLALWDDQITLAELETELSESDT